ncbi:hypothetical protein HMP0721_0920 [Pseudoramibacter alactolyticus ATCC 23263]|uniref:Uncharacterized protein n=1 Tax=Pseudoramibacter alactolyticus ATCC 23263 TaxID=887929 RepID=E6MFY7_9FIRM|nr:hypothetical protein HMP0721_0920 [Pseudoramibacter alactolyticus ATCC 23263]
MEEICRRIDESHAVTASKKIKQVIPACKRVNRSGKSKIL